MLRIRRTVGPNQRHGKRRWRLFISFVVALSVILFFLGFEMWQLWMLVIVVYYVFWCTRMY